MPKRIQMRRDRPWRAENPDAVIVARPHHWGNPFVVGMEGVPDRETAVKLFRRFFIRRMEAAGEEVARRKLDAELRGKDLACWCPLDGPCHADVLLELANQTPLDIVS